MRSPRSNWTRFYPASTLYPQWKEKKLFSLTPRLQKSVVKITVQVVQMTTSENVILYGIGTHWYHQTKVARGVQRKCIFLDLAHGLEPEVMIYRVKSPRQIQGQKSSKFTTVLSWQNAIWNLQKGRFRGMSKFICHLKVIWNIWILHVRFYLAGNDFLDQFGNKI